jgi:hypothetical protein
MMTEINEAPKKSVYKLIGRKEILALSNRTSAMPYGVYIGEDGTETLFNRCYEPIIQRDAKGKNIVKASGWIVHKHQAWFYNDAFTGKARVHMASVVMKAFYSGEPLTKLMINKR